MHIFDNLFSSTIRLKPVYRPVRGLRMTTLTQTLYSLKLKQASGKKTTDLQKRN